MIYKNSLFNIASSGISFILNLAILILTSRILGAEGRGEYSYFVAYVAFFQVFTSIVGNSLMVFFLNKKKVSNILLLTTVWPIPLIFILILIVPYTDSYLAGARPHLVGLIVGQVLYNNLLCYLYYQLDYLKVLLFRFLQPFIVLLWVVYMQNVLRADLLYIIYIISFFPAAVYFLVIIIKNISLSQIRVAELKADFFDYLKKGGLNQINNLLQFGCYRLMIWLLAEKVSIGSVGVFGIWLNMVDAIWLIPTNIAAVNYAYIAKGIKSYPLFKLSVISFFMVLSCIGIALIIPNSFYIQVLGSDFSEVKSLLPISSIGISFFMVQKNISSVFSARGLIHYNTIASGAGLIALLAVGFYGVDNYGLRGAVIANNVSYISSTLVAFAIYRKVVKNFND